MSTDLLFQTKITWLLILGPVALVGDATGLLGEALCFTCSGLALIPCAERLSFVTEQVALHTNGTIGALLNATFGNAPELLIATAALRSGFYRVVQLAMLGSMLTNLLFVFGVSCLVGGLRWQVQELRITSGNVSVLMLLVAVAGSLLPAALSMSGQMQHKDSAKGMPSEDELLFCRVNAFVMVCMYIFYLLFQLGTHKEEFDDEENIVETPDNLLIMSPHFTSRHGRKKRAERNKLCLKWLSRDVQTQRQGYATVEAMEQGALNSKSRTSDEEIEMGGVITSDLSDSDESEEKKEGDGLFREKEGDGLFREPIGYISTSGSQSLPSLETGNRRRHRRVTVNKSFDTAEAGLGKDFTVQLRRSSEKPKSHDSNNQELNGELPSLPSTQEEHSAPLMSFRVGIVWLFIITLCISAMSDILVDTIDGFASRLNLSEVFTSMVIVPFFSNVAEQVSAILFAYRNEMDLCVGVTVGSAIQIACFVMPGCVLIGMVVDRSMTLFMGGYETCCLLFGVVVVAAVLQGGTTNWLVGMSLIGIYTMLAAGFWFHEIEDLSTDAELIFQNQTGS